MPGSAVRRGLRVGVGDAEPKLAAMHPAGRPPLLGWAAPRSDRHRRTGLRVRAAIPADPGVPRADVVHRLVHRAPPGPAPTSSPCPCTPGRRSGRGRTPSTRRSAVARDVHGAGRLRGQARPGAVRPARGHGRGAPCSSGSATADDSRSTACAARPPWSQAGGGARPRIATTLAGAAPEALDAAAVGQAIAEGVLLGSYSFDEYRATKKARRRSARSRCWSAAAPPRSSGASRGGEVVAGRGGAGRATW